MKYLILRNDDIDYFSNVRFLKILIEKIKPFKQTFGIIPYTIMGNKEYCICDNLELINLLQESNYNALHGIFHEYPLGCFEFFNVEPKDPIIEKLKVIKENDFFNINTFIPPHNYISDEWVDLLKKYGFQIFSGTKRVFYKNEEQKIFFKTKDKFECGVIKKEKYYSIPQGIMIKRKNYYKIYDYFCKLLKTIDIYYRFVDVLVLTIHWWDFFNKGFVDMEYYKAFIDFMHELNRREISGVSFNEASNFETSANLPSNIFDLE